MHPHTSLYLFLQGSGTYAGFVSLFGFAYVHMNRKCILALNVHKYIVFFSSSCFWSGKNLYRFPFARIRERFTLNRHWQEHVNPRGNLEIVQRVLFQMFHAFKNACYEFRAYGIVAHVLSRYKWITITELAINALYVRRPNKIILFSWENQLNSYALIASHHHKQEWALSCPFFSLLLWSRLLER